MHAPYNQDNRGASTGQPKDMEPPKQVEKAEAPTAKAKAPAPGAEACCLILRIFNLAVLRWSGLIVAG
eukprot:COSAG02_NODE_3020_length_7534_cov_5.062004_2_plen_68_part_00